ncbi:integral membrane protein TmpA [Aspergillus clavatus NRRL 1]|uniref:Integral membrane protein TmpA n=1 Tax=Aspergillus clavatus (strain ATCC 1007 / CBS 513.65 / DSM 816 / NCTC 3887 / NRRL 1 / QM 1276 / 107) TaxID=344612 RepID=A1CBJ8_ASPCL|nr:integral membrane protein TmpA [Aspergillus clavatus NRRL 1]EAW13116.1 integral membrane protein TmpA [Aspergillus clavatus NRRL 1]
MSLSEKMVISIPPPARCAPGPISPSGTTLVDLEKEIAQILSEKAASDLEAQTSSKKPNRLATVRYLILNIYRRLFSLVFLANIAMFIYVLATPDQKLLALVNATAANVLACGLARQPLVVNAIFVIVCSIPRSAPLRLRRIAAKVYHYGGVHSGCGIASCVWYVGFVGLLSKQYWTPGPAPSAAASFSVLPIVLAYLILVLLLAIIAVAHPTFRSKRHDSFELTHRFSAWLVVILFVILLLVFADETSRATAQSLGSFLTHLPAFWFLLLTVLAILHPWLLLRKVPVRAEPLSPHAVRLHMSHATTTFGKGIQLAKHPLRDWHGFATFPDPLPAPGPTTTTTTPTFSSLISKAGDWTSATIKSPPPHLWKRGVLVYGFAYAMRVFRRLIVVTTGSGIGPCLSFLGDDHRPALRVLWQTRAPLRTYGPAILSLVKTLDRDPLVIDTNSSGRVDMVPEIRRLYAEFGAEAVCVISNPVVTKRVVFELEKGGIPAFGPIFDS